MRIPERFYELYEVESIQIQGKFPSRNNDVLLLHIYNGQGSRQEMVMKKYRNSNWRYNKEVLVLTQLREAGLTVPQIYFTSNNLVMLEYIRGNSLFDVVRELETATGERQDAAMKRIVNDLTNWLYRFYTIMHGWRQKDYIKGDMNLSNFIYTSAGLYGIDFENARTGYLEKDISRLLGVILTAAPLTGSIQKLFAINLFQALKEILPMNQELFYQELTQELRLEAPSQYKEVTEELLDTIVY